MRDTNCSQVPFTKRMSVPINGVRQRGKCGDNRLRPFEAMYKQLVKSANSRGHEVEFSYLQFLHFTEIKRCHYCNSSILWMKYRGHATNLDRKDNTEEYSLENCVVCCSSCNRGKGYMFTYEEWVCMTAALKEYRHGIDKRLPSNSYSTRET